MATTYTKEENGSITETNSIVERKEKAIVQQFDSKLKNVKSQSDLNALKLDFSIIDDISCNSILKRVSGLSDPYFSIAS